jgi:hypothetical protein
LIGGSQLRTVGWCARSLTARDHASAGIDNGDSRRSLRGDGRQALAVWQPADDPSSRTGRDARHRATSGLLVAAGHGRGTLPALDADALDLGIPALPVRMNRVEDDLLDILPGGEYSRAVTARQSAQGDTGLVGAEGDHPASGGEHAPAHGGHDREDYADHGEDHLLVPHEAQVYRKQTRGQGQGGTAVSR